MDSRRRWQIIVGAVLLGGMLLSAAFSLGVYVGEHGWTREGLAYNAPGRLPGGAGPNAARPPGGPADAGVPAASRPPGGPGPGQAPGRGDSPFGAPLPGGRPDVIGRVRRLSHEVLELATPDGSRLVDLDEDTRYLDSQGQPISLQDIAEGDVVGVFGAFTGGDGGQLLAELVILLPPPG